MDNNTFYKKIACFFFYQSRFAFLWTTNGEKKVVVGFRISQCQTKNENQCRGLRETAGPVTYMHYKHGRACYARVYISPILSF